MLLIAAHAAAVCRLFSAAADMIYLFSLFTLIFCHICHFIFAAAMMPAAFIYAIAIDLLMFRLMLR